MEIFKINAFFHSFLKQFLKFSETEYLIHYQGIIVKRRREVDDDAAPVAITAALDVESIDGKKTPLYKARSWIHPGKLDWVVSPECQKNILLCFIMISQNWSSG